MFLPLSASACLHCSCYYSSFAGIKPALVTVNHRTSSPVIATLTPPFPSSSRNPNRGRRSGSNIVAKVLSPAPFDNATTGLHRCRRRAAMISGLSQALAFLFATSTRNPLYGFECRRTPLPLPPGAPPPPLPSPATAVSLGVIWAGLRGFGVFGFER